MLLVIAAFLCTRTSALVSALQGDTIVRVKSGQNATLRCLCPRDETIIFLRWLRLELQSDGYTIFDRYRKETYLNPSFKGRVELKDEDYTLILMTVSIRDAGIYQCWVKFNNKEIRRRGFSFNLTVTPAEQKNITAGQTVVLPCRAPNDNSKPSTGVKWSRPDLEPQNVHLYLDKKTQPEDQHPSFKDRVDLQDRQMKDGDVSLILRDVTINDAGTYECRVFTAETNHGKRTQLDGEHIDTIYLSVAPPPPGPTGGTTEDEDKRMKGRLIRLAFGLCIFCVFVGFVCFLIYRRHKEQNQDSTKPPAEQQQVRMLQLNHEQMGAGCSAAIISFQKNK